MLASLVSDMPLLFFAVMQDMRLVFQNCRIYNVDPNQPVRKIGDRLSDAFEQAWAASGLCSESRAKRATAGVAAAKFEPDDDQLVQQQQQQQPARTKSHSRGQPPRNGQRQAVSGLCGESEGGLIHIDMWEW